MGSPKAMLRSSPAKGAGFSVLSPECFARNDEVKLEQIGGKMP